MARNRDKKDDGILYGWQAIADCLECSIKTAQRLEKNEGLPVLRPDKRQKGRVLALRRSIIDWMTGGIGSITLSGDSLLAFDRRTRLLWAHQFPSQLPKFTSEDIAWRLRLVDLS